MAKQSSAPADETGEIRAVLAEGYPPQHHLLRDLRISGELQKGGRSIIRAPIVPEVCTDIGSVQVGILTILVDVLGGALSLREAAPGWIATADLSINTIKRAKSGAVVAEGVVTRAGRTRVVVEVGIREENPDGASQTIGSAMMTFSRIDGGKNVPKVQPDNNVAAGFDFALETSGFERPCLDLFGMTLKDPSAGVFELELKDYLRNSRGFLPGGIFAVLGDGAGQHAARAATGKPYITSDLMIHFLLPGKIGPFRTQTSLLRTTADTVLSRVNIVDHGAEGQLIGIVMNTAICESAR